MKKVEDQKYNQIIHLKEILMTWIVKMFYQIKIKCPLVKNIDYNKIKNK